MLTPMTEKEQALVIKNVVAATKNILRLNKRGYEFLYLCSGFIAHYNIHGFMDHYQRESLKEDLIDNKNYNRYTNWQPHEADYAYYMAKKNVYNEIVKQLL